jgi:hypothetical protein
MKTLTELQDALYDEVTAGVRRVSNVVVASSDHSGRIDRQYRQFIVEGERLLGLLLLELLETETFDGQ